MPMQRAAARTLARTLARPAPADAAPTASAAPAAATPVNPSIAPRRLLPLGAALLVALGSASAQAGALWVESVWGDLSNNWLAPSVGVMQGGSNILVGSTGRAAPAGTGVIDRDYIRFTVPEGHQLAAIRVLAGTESDATGLPVSFIGLIAGGIGIDPGTVPAATLAAQLMGYYLYGPADIGTDILAGMAANNLFTGAPYNQPPAQGFSTPLGPGTYTLWIQETVVGRFNYSFDLQVVPEPSALALALAALGGAALAGRALRPRRRAGAAAAAAAAAAGAATRAGTEG